MTNKILQSGFVALAAVLAVAVSAAAPAVYAQEKKAAAKPAEKKKKKTSAWVKLCEKAPFAKKDKDGKTVTDKDGKAVADQKQICLTHHERLDGNTGMVLVSAAIREVEGSDKKSIMVMVPLGMAIPAGVRAAVYNKEQWAKAAKKEKVDDKSLKPLSLKYSLCHSAGCTAEAIAPPDLVESMKNGGGLMVLAMNAAAKPIGFPVPLSGFNEAHAGKPIDNKKYAEARSKLMQQIRKRQQDAYKAYKEIQETAKEQDAAKKKKDGAK